MAPSHLFKQFEMMTSPTPPKTDEKRITLVDNKLRSILLESNSKRLLRQQAGLDSSRKRRRPQKVAVPNAYRLQAEYNRNRKQRQLRLKGSLRPLRKQVNTPHPVPNFSALHRRWEQRNRLRQLRSAQQVTEPITPRTLLSSQRFREKWASKQIHWKRQEEQELTHRPNLCSKFFDPWRKRPFVPRITSTIVQTKPFKLRSVERGVLRKKFDMWQMGEQNSREQLETGESTRRWQNEYREARKLTQFKARPNPWKRTKAPAN
ncbi:uncharacterized protein LOC6562596 [Drosophila grimshawi]|uniref:GH11664 n=1 Tax=Drosophila grimshawi TaxID=7222 RepID=B4JCM9_DROGR|nr:uncharacterized protein LOC6562596 [Drosophila grimshawi]EDW04193.1 GH11664 [Drosophila grimshawi]